MAKHRSFREDPKYLQIEKRWRLAFRRWQRVYGEDVRPSVMTLELLRARRAELERAERVMEMWERNLTARRAVLIVSWRAEGTFQESRVQPS